jgi:hypothetical protein
MPIEEIPPSLQEGILSALIFDERHGAVIAGQVTPALFDEGYREIAERVLAYRRKYRKAPGRTHLDDLFGKLLQPGRAPRIRRLVFDLAELADTINGDYLVARTQEFVRQQRQKSALIEANSRFEQGGEGLADDIDAIFSRATKFRAQTMERGTFLNDTSRSLKFFERSSNGISLGIEVLDRLGVLLAPKEQTLLISPKGCLAGDTLIDCPRDLSVYPQGIPIKELVGKQFYTYSWSFEQSKPCVSKVLDVWCSGVKPVYRVRLYSKLRQRVGNKRGGTRRAKYLPPLELVGTFDHPVLLANGSWRKLGELQPKDSLKSLYRRAESGEGGYCCLSWTAATTNSVREHQFVCSGVHGPRPGTAKEFHAHHRNDSSYDNSPNNLEWKASSDHASDHLAAANRRGTTGWKVTGKHPRGMLGKLHLEKTKERQRKVGVLLAKSKERNSSGRFVKSPNHTVVSVEYLGIQPVFDMEVEGSGNFVANGVFVHNSGKSWCCVNVGVQGLLNNRRVAHISLEMPEPQVTGRYYQRVFAAAMRPDKYNKSYLEFDERLQRLTGFRTRLLTPKWSFTETGAMRELKRRISGPWGQRFGNLVVKSFPSGQLTIQGLEAYLDYLELEEKFIPHVLIVDYPDLMAMDSKNLRISMGRTFVELRGLAAARNLALFTPTQSGRDTIGGKYTKSGNVTEDISKVFTADQTLTYQQTPAEKVRGLARVMIEHARGVPDGTMIIITQSYATGQYALQSAIMQNAYWERLNALSGDDRDD